jgi:hypothetical protein
LKSITYSESTERDFWLRLRLGCGLAARLGR